MPQTRREKMRLGIEEVTEVWFLPANRESYYPSVLQEFTSVDYARHYINEEAARYAGELEMVRVTTHRQRVA
jgi:hypothetical protein